MHEFGHTLQCMVLGPLFFPIIALPSVVWCNAKCCVKKHKNDQRLYTAFYPERNADWIGKKFVKEYRENTASAEKENAPLNS
jgi:hypothetical protein